MIPICKFLQRVIPALRWTAPIVYYHQAQRIWKSGLLRFKLFEREYLRPNVFWKCWVLRLRLFKHLDSYYMFGQNKKLGGEVFFSTDCSALKILFENMRAPRHRKKYSLCRCHFRFFYNISSAEQSGQKVWAPQTYIFRGPICVVPIYLRWRLCLKIWSNTYIENNLFSVLVLSHLKKKSEKSVPKVWDYLFFGWGGDFFQRIALRWIFCWKMWEY